MERTDEGWVGRWVDGWTEIPESNGMTFGGCFVCAFCFLLLGGFFPKSFGLPFVFGACLWCCRWCSHCCLFLFVAQVHLCVHRTNVWRALGAHSDRRSSLIRQFASDPGDSFGDRAPKEGFMSSVLACDWGIMVAKELG